ncbi:MAG: hypothetical protein ABJN69_08045 [Hellea sp.]
MMSSKDVKDAISLMRGLAIPVETTPYGFSVKHSALSDQDFAQCGVDNDSSISMSVNVDEDPPVKWFFRMSFLEMAHFIVDAYAATGKAKPARQDIVNAMRVLDDAYDETELDKMTSLFLGE